MSAMIYRADGSCQPAIPQTPNNWSLKELQDIVCGYIEIIPTKIPGQVLVINEDGKRLGLTYNAAASAMVSLFPGDFIVGDALFCGAEEIS